MHVHHAHRHACMCFHANMTVGKCRQFSNTSMSQVWKKNIENWKSYSSFNWISLFTCITRTHMHACSRKMRSVPHIYTACLFILKRFQLHLLSSLMRTLANKKVGRRNRKKRIIIIIRNRVKTICSQTSFGEYNCHNFHNFEYLSFKLWT